MKLILIGMALLLATVAQSQPKKALTVYFDFNKSELSEHEKMRVDSFLTKERALLPPEKLQLNGYCDSVGSYAYNLALSLQRMAMVKKLLIHNYNIPASVIAIKAFGEKKPVNNNATEEERQLNRRVEIILLPPAKLLSRNQGNLNLKAMIADTTIAAGTNIVLKNINFYGGQHELVGESGPVLEELLDAMKTYPKLVIDIQGHICCELSPADGMDTETGIYNLSEARAKAIYDYLLANGIEPGRISYQGFGHSKPLYLYPEQSEEQRVANRRVEIKILKK